MCNLCFLKSHLILVYTVFIHTTLHIIIIPSVAPGITLLDGVGAMLLLIILLVGGVDEVVVDMSV